MMPGRHNSGEFIATHNFKKSKVFHAFGTVCGNIPIAPALNMRKTGFSRP
jgi:hypothetical protein